MTVTRSITQKEKEKKNVTVYGTIPPIILSKVDGIAVEYFTFLRQLDRKCRQLKTQLSDFSAMNGNWWKLSNKLDSDTLLAQFHDLQSVLNIYQTELLRTQTYLYVRTRRQLNYLLSQSNVLRGYGSPFIFICSPPKAPTIFSVGHEICKILNALITKTIPAAEQVCIQFNQDKKRLQSIPFTIKYAWMVTLLHKLQRDELTTAVDIVCNNI